jgi:hypothetical protein
VRDSMKSIHRIFGAASANMKIPSLPVRLQAVEARRPTRRLDYLAQVALLSLHML